MITLKSLVLAHQRRTDGTYNVKIRVTYKGVQKYLATTITARASDLTRSLTLKAGPAKVAADELVAKIERILADFPVYASATTCEDVVRFVRARMDAQAFALDFYAFGEEFLKTKTPQTAEVYRSALRSFARSTGAPLDINAIRKATVQQYIDDNPAIDTGSRLSYISAVFREARRKYNDEDEGVILIPRDPFSSFSCVSTPKGRGAKPLTAELLQRLINERPRTRNQRRAVALGLLSFCLLGANLADIAEARPFSGDVWVYRRKKTRSRRSDKAEMHVQILPPARMLADYLGGSRERWVAGLAKWPSHQANNRYKDLAGEWGIEPFSFYSFRKAWATIARRLGVEKATIDEGLAHVGDFRLADIYISRDYKAMNEANAKVVGSLDWSNCWCRCDLDKVGGDK